jgi:hypothetical protein
MFTAWGHWDQFIFIIPSLDLVVVRVGNDRDGSFDVNQFLKLVIAAFRRRRRVRNKPSDFCIRYVQQSRSDLFVDTDVDDAAKTVTAKALLSPTHKARFVSDKLGCKLD